MDISYLVAILAVLCWALRSQLQARDPTAARRNPRILRALTRSELRLVAAGAANDTPRGGGGWSATMETTREQRDGYKILFGLSGCLAECAEALEVALLPDPKAEGRFAVMLFRKADRDELRYRPGLEDEAMVVLCGEALKRADVYYTDEDARALAAELVANRAVRNIAQQKSGQRNI